MSYFNIHFDPLTKQFENHFPIFLNDKRITPDQYKSTLNHANVLVQSIFNPVYRFGTYFGITLAVMVILFFIIFFTPILHIFFFIFFFCGTLAVIKKSNDAKKKLKQEMIHFLEQENQRIFYSKGVQFLYGTSSAPVDQYDMYNLTVQDIQIVLAQTPFTPTQQQVMQYLEVIPIPQQPSLSIDQIQPLTQTVPQLVYYNTNGYQNL